MIALLLAVVACATYITCQPPQPVVVPAAGADPPLPPNRGFQLKCSDQYAYLDVCDPELFRLFQDNAPPGYTVTSVDPCIYPGKNAHRYVVRYQSNTLRRCEDIRRVRHEFNTFKPQNSNVGSIAVIPGGFSVEYKQFCLCYRRGYRRRRGATMNEAVSFLKQTASSFFIKPHPPDVDQAGNVVRCDDRDFTCGPQNF